MKKRPSMQETGNLFACEEANEAFVEPQASYQLHDREQRAKALDVTNSWIVEAPAGSGKTSLLIKRYLKLLSLPDIEQPEQVLAITFTVKATGEIRERILKELESAAQTKHGAESDETQRLAASVLERDRMLGWKLLDRPKRLNIRTIDSICAEIAQGLPLLSGGSGLAPIKDSTPLYRLAAERTLLQLGGEDVALNKALSVVLLHRDGNLLQTRDLLADLLSLRDQWGRLVPLDRESLEEDVLDNDVRRRLEDALAEAICRELEQLLRIFPASELVALSSLAAELGGNEGYGGQPSPIAVCRGKGGPPAASVADLDRWRALAHLLIKADGKWRSGFNSNVLGFTTTKREKERLREVSKSLEGNDVLLSAVNRAAALPPAIYPQEQWEVAKALFHVLYRALAELQLVFAERGECDFAELGLLARAALRHGGAALDTIPGLKLQHMLVDEMQDTSTSQYELIELLTQDWDGRSQTLFLVGDPKQSIYLFRQARVERFIRTMEELRLGEMNLGSLLLTSNFRSQAGLVKSFNDDFSRIFPGKRDKADLGEAVYTRADAVRPFAQENSIVWHTQVVSREDLKEDRRRTRHKVSHDEAQSVRGIVEHWRAKELPAERHGKPWKIAVLVRNRNHLTQVVAELKRASIPFRAVDIDQLGERPEVLDLFALTRALLHPADRVAWLAVLRAPWCGLELAELHKLCGADDPAFAEHTVPELIAERGHELSEDSILRLQRLWPVFSAAANRKTRLGLAELVERTWYSLGGSAYLTEEEAANAKRYFQLLDEAEVESAIVDLTQLKQRLGQLYAAPTTRNEAVDLMTIHGAKGLEWDVVIVPGLEKKIRSTGGRLLSWEELAGDNEHQPQVIFAPIAGKGEDSEALNVWLREIHRRRDEAECRRLFYVACTRAREELHLFATVDRRSDQSIRPLRGSLLEAAWPAAEGHFVDNNIASKPLIAPVITMPQQASTHSIGLSIAAEAEISSARTQILYRVPITFQGLRALPAIVRNSHSDGTFGGMRFARPEGSLESRVLGNTVHAFLEVLARELSSGKSVDALRDELGSWRLRIASLARNSGLSPSEVQGIVVQTLKALTATLSDPYGLWVLAPHKQAASERALTSWDETRSSVRLDRIFEAGEAPLAPGDGHLWIVDFKTAQYGGQDLDDFLRQERDKYIPQMSVYAETVLGSGEERQLKIGLYYPLISKLIWWEHGNSPDEL
ncbi:MAG: UvrD-helicase domain-containing protein [Acidobacteria bacterium]|nr:UvrD-helicase domain-containing protein [Acidobacteriota bacterium]